MNKFCVYCGNEIDDTDNVCGNCGKSIKNDEIIENKVNRNYIENDGFAIAGFVLSLISIFSCGSFSILGLIFSIIGLININKNNKSGKVFAISGIVISSILLIFYFIALMSGILRISGMYEQF